ncbi:hypothetical protein RQP46_008501 [Phenoliferia psychrophenolica]
MSEPLEQLPQLPVETWTTIVSDASLSYFDLKRISRVSHTFRTITESPTFDATLFRGAPQAPSTLSPRSTIAIHPALLACDELVGINISSGFLIKAVNYQDERTWPIGTLACAAREFATSPPLTHLAIDDIGIDNEHEWIARSSTGVTIEDLLKVVVRAWDSEIPDHVLQEMWLADMEDGKEQGDSPSYLPETWYENQMERSGRRWKLKKEAIVSEGGDVVLRRAWRAEE